MTDKQMDRRKFMQDAAAGAAGVAVGLGAAHPAWTKPMSQSKAKILCYNPDMEYRRLGKTNLMVSAVCLGGHWKRVNVMKQDFDQNRLEVVNRCMEIGVNYIDACCKPEVIAYSKALRGRRDKMYMALSYCGKETRNPNYRTAKKSTPSTRR